MSGTSDSDDTSASPAAEEVAGNEDLIREIFLRIPTRPLITFKSVSKHWSSLISDPQFSLHHTLKTNPSSIIPTGIFFYNSITKTKEIDYVSLASITDEYSRARVRVRAPSLSFLDEVAKGATIKILQSISGLFLCRFTSLSNDSEVKYDYCVCNPTTKHYTIIPQPRLIEHEKIVEFSLAFEPSDSPYYKVICVKSLTRRYLGAHSLGLCQIDIYSSESQVWRETSCRFEDHGYVKFDKPAIYWNGRMHWITSDLMRYYTVEFDINEESFKGSTLMHQMAHGYHNTPLRYLGECRGHLHVIYVRTPSSKLFRVLERDRETLKWCVKYRIHLNRLLPTFPEIVLQTGHWAQYNFGVEYAFSILYVYKGEKEEDSAMVLTIPGKVISYNFFHKTVKVLRELPSQEIDTSRHQYVTGFHFVETLALA